MQRTNIPARQFDIYLEGAVGNATTAKGSNLSSLAGVGVQYCLTSILSWSTLHASWIRIGAQNAAELSSGLLYAFK